MTCPSCAGPIRAGDAFCPSCGTKQPAASAARSDTGERRQLTVMFYDLVGSTELGTRTDPDDLQLAMHRFQEMCATLARDVDGYPARTMGDGGLIYFGYPEAHEDDPFRAVMAAQAMIDGLPALNEALHVEIPAFADDLRMRIGIHSGSVVMGHEGSDLGNARLAIGEALNLGARIESLAPVNGIAVSEATARRIRGVVELASLGHKTAKGIPEPIEIFSVERIRPGQTRFSSLRGRSPFVGRDTEFQRLQAAWTGAQQGHGTTVVIRGEAGLGKTRLHQHLRHTSSGTPHAWFELYGSEVMRQSAFHPIVQVIRQLLDMEGRTPDEQRARLHESLEPLDLLDDAHVGPLEHLLGLAGRDDQIRQPETLRRATIDALCDWWLAIADLVPTVVVAEDLHWFDPSTIDVLTELSARATDRALLLIGTIRPHTDVEWGDDREIIDLAPLPPDEIHTLVDHLAKRSELSPHQRSQLASRSDGVPLFAEELVLAAADDVENATAVPETLRELMTARLDNLGTAKPVVQLAALLGREFSHGHLAAVAETDDLGPTLDLLTEHNFIARRPDGDRTTFVFRHALLQDAARDSMLRRHRQMEHRRIAAVLVDTFAGTPDARPEIIGHHHAEGAEPLLAAEQFRIAGRNAAHAAALRECAAHTTRAIELLTDIPAGTERDDLEVELHVQLGSALARAEGMVSPGATAAHERAVEMCRRMDPPHADYAHALDGVLQSRLTSGHFAAALEAGEELLAWAEKNNDRPAARAAHAALCQVHFWQGRYVDCWMHAARAWDLYDPGAPESERYSVGIDTGITALAFGAVGAWAMGHGSESAAMADRCLRLAGEQEDPYQLAFSQAYLSMHAIMLNDPERVERLATGGQQLSALHAFIPMEGLSTFTLGWARAEMGDPGGLDIARAGVNQLAGIGAQIGAPGCMAVLAEMCAKAGELDEGLGYVALGEAMAEGSDQHFYTAEIHRSSALLHLVACERSSGEEAAAALAAARAAAQKSIDVARSQHAPSLELRGVQAMLTVLRAEGDQEVGRRLLQAAIDRFPDGSSGIDLDRARDLVQSNLTAL